NGFSYHLAYTYSKNDDSDSDRIVSFSLSVPLSRWLPNSWASYNISNSQRGDTSQNVGLGGTLLDDQRLSYSLQQSHTNHGGTDNSSIYSSYRSQYANFSGGYYYASDDSRQISYSVSGAVVAHPRGITLAQPLSREFAIVNTDDASGLRFQNQRGVQTDAFGNAVIPSLSAYQENRITLDTTTLPDDVDTNATAVTAHFSTWVGYRVVSHLTARERQPRPLWRVR
ncbi:MAG: fimbria/pilus outer membrane usher protein, partial [Kluyvera sp.]